MNNSCFVCGSDNSRGLKVGFSIDKNRGSAESQLIIPEDFSGWENTVHGGILVSILDDAMVHACLSQDRKCVTVALDVRFHKSVKPGTEIKVYAEIIKKIPLMYIVKAEILENNKKSVSAQGKLYIRKDIS